MNDLLSTADTGGGAYTARDIEVLEGLEPVRRRPGMYIGGTDDAALHHLAAEILDNAMDEAVAGHATAIDVTLEAGNYLAVRDNGRGIPVDPHPKFKDMSALEVILTTLHSGGKFGGKAYATSGGLHGVGSSVVNALSDEMAVEVARDRILWRQGYARGKPVTKLVNAGPVQNRRGTMIRFHPDPEIFGALQFAPTRLYKLCRSKAYLFRGVRIRWACDPGLLKTPGTPAEAVLHFPGGLKDSLKEDIGATPMALPEIWAGEAELGASNGQTGGAGGMGRHVARRRRGLPRLLLQHRPHRTGWHARAGVPGGAPERAPQLGRAARQQESGAGHARGRDRPDGRQALRLRA